MRAQLRQWRCAWWGGCLRALLLAPAVLVAAAHLPGAHGGEGVLRINCGSTEPVEFEGDQWLPDAFYLGGEPRAVLPAAPDTLQPPLHGGPPGPPPASAPAPGPSQGSPWWTTYTTSRAFPPDRAGGCYGIPLVPQVYIVRLRFAPPVPPPCNPAALEGTTTSVRKCMQSGAWPGGAAAAPGAAVGVPGLGCDDNATLPAGEVWPLISITIGGQQMEVVRMELHRERVYRTEFLVDLSAQGPVPAGLSQKVKEAAAAAGEAAEARMNAGGPERGAWGAAGAILAEVGEGGALLTVCLGALQGTAYVNAMEVVAVPRQLYRGVASAGTLARRDQVAAGAGMVPVMLADDVAERRWHLKKTPRAVALQACSAAVAEGGEGGEGEGGGGPSGLGGSSQKLVMRAPVLAMVYEIVRSPAFVPGGMLPPLFLPHSLLQTAFTPAPGHKRLHFEWHKHVMGRRNPWLLLLVLSEFNSSAQPGDRTFDIRVNGETVLPAFDILGTPGASSLVHAQTSGAQPGWAEALGVGSSIPITEEAQAMMRGSNGEGGSGGARTGRGPSPRIVVITVWNRRPKTQQVLPMLELDLVPTPGSRLRPMLSVVEVFELVMPGGLSSRTELSVDALTSGTSDIATVGWGPPGTTFEGANNTGGTHSNVVAAVVVGSVGSVLLVSVMLGLMLLWRRQERSRAQRAERRRAAAAAAAAGAVNGAPAAGEQGGGGGWGGGGREGGASEASSETQSPYPGYSPDHALEDAQQGVPLARGQTSSSRPEGHHRHVREIQLDLEGG